MFLRLFRNAVSEREERPADGGPALPERPERFLEDRQGDASTDSSGVMAGAAPGGTLEGHAGDQPELIEEDGSHVDREATAASGRAEEPVGESPPAESVAGHSLPGEPVNVQFPSGEHLAVEAPRNVVDSLRQSSHVLAEQTGQIVSPPGNAAAADAQGSGQVEADCPACPLDNRQSAGHDSPNEESRWTSA